MSQARFGAGATLTIDSKLVAEAITFGAIEPTADTIDVSNHDGTSNYKEFINGMKDAGEFTIEGNYIAGSAGQLELSAAFTDGEIRECVITFPKLSTESSAPKWEFDAIVTKASPISEANMTDQLKFSATLKISGAPVFTDAVSATTTTTTTTSE